MATLHVIMFVHEDFKCWRESRLKQIPTYLSNLISVLTFLSHQTEWQRVPILSPF